MATLRGPLDGRSWDVDSLDGTAAAGTASHKGVSSVTRVYTIERTAAEMKWDWRDEKSYEDLFASTPSLPKIGDAHGSGDSSLRVSRISYAEGSGAEKRMLKVTVTYSRTGEEQAESGQGAIDCACESWGWHSGSTQRDLMAITETTSQGTTTVSRTPPVNSAGDPFDSVPQVDFPSPTFTKVFKTKVRIPSLAWTGKVNSGSVTIGSMSCGERTLKCVQCDEDRIINDPLGYRYRYSIGLQYLSNVCKVVGENSPVEIGWDAAVADTGLRALEYPGGGGEETLTRCHDVDANGESFPVSLPVALDGTGHRDTGGEPVFLRFQAYPTTTFPNVFYSEPA